MTVSARASAAIRSAVRDVIARPHDDGAATHWSAIFSDPEVYRELVNMPHEQLWPIIARRWNAEMERQVRAILRSEQHAPRRDHAFGGNQQLRQALADRWRRLEAEAAGEDSA
jgi:hypothetical protein